jgi:hypothetical protein
MSTYSSLKFELILTGDQSGQWGNTTNTNIGTAIEQAIVGMATLSSSNFTANVATLTLADTNAAQNARALCLNIAAGAVSAAGTINVPAIQKPYIIINGSSFTVTVKVSGQTGVAVPSGKRTVVYNNGTDVGNQVDYLPALALGTALPATSGGTGQSGYAVGDLLYASTTTALSKLPDVATGNALISGGVTTAPSWGKIGLTTHVDGTLAATNGGTGASTTSVGDILYGSASNTWTKLAGNTTTTRKYLVSVGDGTNATAPAWDQIDISTSDITGTLGAGNGGTGQSTYTAGDILYASGSTALTKLAAGTAGQLLQTNGAAAPSWVNAPTFTGVSSFSAGTTGLTPNSGTTGAVTLAGTLAVGNGGSGQTTAQLAMNAFAGAVTSGSYLRGNGTNVVMSAIQAADVPTLNQSTTGSAANLSGGSNYQIPFQLGGGTTFAPAPTTASTYLSWTGSAFVWAAVSGGGSVPGGLANQIVYQSAPSTSTFIAAPTTASTYLSWNGSSFAWANVTPGSTFAGDISVNGLTVGRGTASVASNTALGYQANNAVTTSIGLTSVGYQANALCTTSDRHTAIGYQANAAMTNMGATGLDFEGNTAVGYKALQSNVGFVAFTSNTAVGAAAGQGLTTGYLNVSIGSAAGPTVGTASTVCVGQKAGYRYQGAKSVIIGAAAYSQVVGAGAGNDIVAVGFETLYDTALGTAGATVEDTTAVGSQALRSIDPSGGAQSYRNTAVGSGAGYNLLSGTNNTLLGFNAQASTTTASNEFVLGNSSVSVLRCQVSTISGLSDARDKYDIEDLPLGLDFINSLKARRFKWDKRDAYFDRVRDEDGRAIEVAVPKDGSRKSNEWNEGFIAQEVDEAATAAGADWMRIVHKANPERLEMAPGKLIPVLVNAIQELTARLEALEARN